MYILSNPRHLYYKNGFKITIYTIIFIYILFFSIFIQSNPCDITPCLNGGICTNIDDDNYECNCTSTDHFGTNCSLSNPCKSFDCDNDGLCIPITETSVTCNCTGTGYKVDTSSGKCTTDICDNSVCFHNGICTFDGIDDYYCKDCDIGWIDKNCNSNICDTTICANNGVCYDDGKCNCKNTGYNGSIIPGDNCTISDCASSPCLNDGICSLNNNQYICTCTDDYWGTNCQCETGIYTSQCPYTKEPNIYTSLSLENPVLLGAIAIFLLAAFGVVMKSKYDHSGAVLTNVQTVKHDHTNSLSSSSDNSDDEYGTQHHKHRRSIALAKALKKYRSSETFKRRSTLANGNSSLIQDGWIKRLKTKVSFFFFFFFLMRNLISTVIYIF